MKIKKLIIAVLAVVLGCSAFLFVSCKNDNNDSSGGGDSPVTERVYFSETSVSCVIGETRYLSATYEGEQYNEIAYSSANAAIASVTADGVLTAVAIGQTTITATAGNASADLTVNVGTGEGVPVLVFDESITNSEIKMGITDSFNLSAHVAYNGSNWSDAQLTYSMTNQIGSVTGGMFVPAQTGETVVTVTAAWRNYTEELSASVKVAVVNEIELYVNDNIPDNSGEIVIYNVGEFGGKTWATEMDFAPHAYQNGKELTAGVRVKSGSDVVEYDQTEKKLKSKKYGFAEVEIYCEDSLGTEYTKTYSIKVNVAVADYDGVIDFSVADGTFDVESIFGKGVNIVEAYEGKKEYVVEDGKVLGVAIGKDGTKPEVRTITVCSDTCGYNIDFKIYAKILKTAADFECFEMKTDSTSFDGYYILANDIDASAYTHKNGIGRIDATSARWFMNDGYSGGLKGTFDGNGHTIKNITIGSHGLFGAINGGTVKNVAFENAKVDGGNSSVLAWYIFDGAIENVYLHLGTLPYIWGRSVISSYALQTDFKNVIVELDGINSASIGNCGGDGSFVTNNALKTESCDPSTFSNVYVISGFACSENYDAENISGAVNVYTGVKRYADLTEFLSAKGNDYSAFESSGMWNISEGYPTFKGKRLMQLVEGVKVYSLTDGFDKADLNAIFGEETVTFVSATDKTNGVTVTADGGKLLFSKNGKPLVADGSVHTITVNAGGVKDYVINVKLVTKVIKTASDLEIFKITNTYNKKGDNRADDFGEGSLFDGYYVLGNDIDATGYTHQNGITDINAANQKNVNYNGFANWDNTVPYCGLSGTFDGNGYTISNLTPGKYGLFGLIHSGTVKNVAIKTASYMKANCSVLAWNLTKATIENVYIHIEGMDNDYGRSALAYAAYNTKMKNVFVNVAYYNTASIGQCGGDGSLVSYAEVSGDYADTFENVYVISNIKCSDTIDAENIETELTKYTGVRRYETIEAMKADTANDYTAFKNSGFWSIESGYPVFKKA